MLHSANILTLWAGTGEQSLLYKRNHAKGSLSVCSSLIKADCFASPFEEGKGCNGICSFSAPRPPDTFSKPKKLLIFSITEPTEGQFSNSGKQVEIKGNKVMTSFKYSHFMRYRSHSCSFPHVIVIALELFITGQVLIPGIQSKNVLLYYRTTLEGDEKTQMMQRCIKLTQTEESYNITAPVLWNPLDKNTEGFWKHL